MQTRTRVLSILTHTCSALLLATAFASPARAGAHGEFSDRPDGHAPIGVMGDHLHDAGEVMLSYRYARMRMDGSRDDTNRLSPTDVFAEGFPVSPTDMDMEMHMLGLMVAPTDWLTVMSMIPFVSLSMDHVTGMGGAFQTDVDDIGDLKMTGLLRVWENEAHRFLFNAGFSFPTGKLSAKDTTPMGKVQLPYPMQISSGSFEVMPGVSYVGHSEGFSWGAQAMGRIPLDENKNDYRLGNRVDLSVWLQRPWTSWLSTSLRFAYEIHGNIKGSDPALNPALVYTADPNRRAGQRLDILPGVNIALPLGPLGLHRLGIEAGFPIFQRLDGPQLETDWRVTVGWQYAFDLFGG